MVVLLLAVIGTYLLNRSGILHGLEHWALDLELASRGQPKSEIAIVDISDADYDDVFDGRSPLNPEKLHDLIGAIARSKPKLIAVDIDTSHKDFHNFKIDPNWPPVIWERDISRTSGERGEEMKPLDVLGGQPEPNRSGIPVLFDDPDDKVTRFYMRCIDTIEGRAPSFVYIAATAFRDGNFIPPASACADRSSTRLAFIRYSLDGEKFLPAARVLELSDKKGKGRGEQIIPELANKLVLLGGSFGDYDRHFTPLGAQPGVLVLANAIQTELDGNFMKASPNRT
jgi:hypothetical protein